MIHGEIQEVTDKVNTWGTKMETISQASKKILLGLIRKEFDTMNDTMDWVYNTSNNLIDTAKELGFVELVTEMENDKKF